MRDLAPDRLMMTHSHPTQAGLAVAVSAVIAGCIVASAETAVHLNPIVVLGAAGAVALALLALAKPRFAIVLVAIALSLNGEGAPLQWSVVGMRVTAGNLLLAIVVLASIGNALRFVESAFSSRGAVIALAYGSVMLISAVASPTGGITEVLKWAVYWGCLYPVAFALLRTRNHVSVFLTSMAVIAAAQSLVMLLQVSLLHDERPLGTIGINVGFVIALGCVVALRRALAAESPSRRWIWILILMLSGTGLLLSLTRAAWLAAIAGIVCSNWLVGKGGRGHFFRTTAATIAVLGFLLIAPGIGDPVRMRLATLGDDLALLSSPTSNSVFARNGLAEVAVDMAAKNPVLGVGPGQFPVNLREYAIANDKLAILVDQGVLFALGPHNQLLNSAAEVGILGALLFVMLIAATFRDAVTLARSHDAATQQLGAILGGWIAAYSIGSLLDDTAYGLHLYLLIAMIACVQGLRATVDLELAAPVRQTSLPDARIV